MGYYRDIVKVLRDTFLRYSGVRTFRYQSEDLNNAQNNFDSFQVYVDDMTRHELNITTNVFKAEFSIYILKQPEGESGSTVIDIQDQAYVIAANVIAKLDNMMEYHGILQVHDWSIVTVSHVTDDDAAGVHLTLVLEMPNPANLCDDDNWSDEPYSGETEYDIDVDAVEPGELDINPITLPKNPIRC